MTTIELYIIDIENSEEKEEESSISKAKYTFKKYDNNTYSMIGVINNEETEVFIPDTLPELEIDENNMVTTHQNFNYERYEEVFDSTGDEEYAILKGWLYLFYPTYFEELDGRLGLLSLLDDLFYRLYYNKNRSSPIYFIDNQGCRLQSNDKTFELPNCGNDLFIYNFNEALDYLSE